MSLSTSKLSIAKQRTLGLALLVPFLILSIYAVQQVGYIGIFDYQLQSPAGWQVMADLVIALILVLGWMIPDAKRRNRNPWPWLILTLTLGSIGPLLYIVFGKTQEQ
jgi:drug/metabolite transporter (DMT)-like permease